MLSQYWPGSGHWPHCHQVITPLPLTTPGSLLWWWHDVVSVTLCYDWAPARTMLILETQNIADTASPGPGGRSPPVSLRPVLASEGCPWLRGEAGLGSGSDRLRSRPLPEPEMGPALAPGDAGRHCTLYWRWFGHTTGDNSQILNFESTGIKAT